MEKPLTTPPLTDNEPLWTVADVMAFLKVSKSWVYHRADTGQLPAIRIIGHIRFRAADIRRLVADAATQPEAAV
jgi:predicted DNA-binding transcriptional regulator AlpA